MSGTHRTPSLFGEATGGTFASVAADRHIDSVYTYRVPDRLEGLIKPGLRVRVPFGKGNRGLIGYCVELLDGADLGPEVDRDRVKEIQGVLDESPLVDQAMLRLTRWIADYYMCPWGQVLDAVVPAGVKRWAGARLRTELVLSDPARSLAAAPPLPLKQKSVYELLHAAEGPIPLDEVMRQAGCGPGAIAALRKSGLVLAVRRRPREPRADAVAAPIDSPPVAAPSKLTTEQQTALDAILECALAPRYQTYLLQGVTGSGKTEVYLKAIEAVTAAGREAIVLVPEISLTPQTIARFRNRFKRVAVLHSHLSDTERHAHWRAIASGEVQVAVGARSAVFAPTRRLGLIVIDEEHESSFKQESAPRYHARDVAVMRARESGVPVVLGSATPSLESRRNADLGRYRLLTLLSRVSDRPMPEVAMIDLRYVKPPRDRPKSSISEPLRVAIEGALAKGGQVILLLNRRGFHTFVVCPKCGATVKCDSCDLAMTHHKSKDLIICHICGLYRDPPTVCPECRSANLFYGGAGAERLERDAREAFPNRVIRRMDSDTMAKSGSHERALREFELGMTDILLGTQMIAKGLDFPNVTLVGVVNADIALHLPDFRASERTFQLVAQVSGRAGRGDKPGKVLVQTFSPEHAAIEAAAQHDYEMFYKSEMPFREAQGYPPFGRLARLVARGPRDEEVAAYLDAVRASLAEHADASVKIDGPAPAPIAKIRDLYRRHLQVRAASSTQLHAVLNWVSETTLPKGVELAVDIDPAAML